MDYIHCLVYFLFLSPKFPFFNLSLSLFNIYTLADQQNEKEQERDSILSALAKYRPCESIFEVASSTARKKGVKTSSEALLMQKRRGLFGEKIAQRARKDGEAVLGELERQKSLLERESGALGEDEVEFDGFNDLSGGKSRFHHPIQLLCVCLSNQTFTCSCRIRSQER